MGGGAAVRVAGCSGRSRWWLPLVLSEKRTVWTPRNCVLRCEAGSGDHLNLKV